MLEILQSLQGPTRAQRGCTDYVVYQEEGADSAVVLVERWESDAALQSHLRSDAYRSVLSAVELSGRPPEIRFEHVTGTEGIELIERARAVDDHVSKP